MKVGDLFFIKDKVSADSMKLWKFKSRLHSFLICPCKIPKLQTLKVEGILSNNIVMLSFYNNPAKVTILYTKDLKAAHKA